MQDDKRQTVEDQELADMIASISSPKTTTPPPSGPAPRPVVSPAPIAQSTPPTGSTFTPPAPAPVPSAIPAMPTPPMPAPAGTATPPAPTAPVTPTPPPLPVAKPTTPSPALKPLAKPDNLDAIKKNALDELRPLVNRLDLPADERFDTLLLLIRSTDDNSLIKPAYETAQLIKDDTKRAQALLDIVKEIDFFENQD